MPQYKYQLKDGIKWASKFNYTDPASGNIKTAFKRGFDTKRQAKQYEEDFFKKLAEKEEECGPLSRTFGDVFQEYLMSHKRADLKESTLETKFNIFKNYIFPTFEFMPIEAITADDIAAWQKDMKVIESSKGRPLSDAYLRTVQCQFNSIINYARDKGYLKSYPLADIKNMGRKDIRVEFWTPEQYERFAYHAMAYPQYYYAYEVLYWCGLRLGEMMALTLNDVNFDEGVISVTKTFYRRNKTDIITSPKTPSAVRKVSMPGFLVDELKEYVGLLHDPKGEDRLFQVSKTDITVNFRKLTANAGLKRITLHGLRHSHVSLLISKKYDIFEVSKRIGHKSVKTTQDVYGHLFDDVQKSIANDLDRIRRGA